jgi:hypothetical protein
MNAPELAEPGQLQPQKGNLPHINPLIVFGHQRAV